VTHVEAEQNCMITFLIPDRTGISGEERSMDVVLILVSLGIATGPEPIGQPLLVGYFDNMKSCVAAANQAKLPVAGEPGRSLNTWAQFVCVPTKSAP
jgi:hypothetical protein